MQRGPCLKRTKRKPLLLSLTADCREAATLVIGPNLPPTYVMRYKVMDSGEIFEADPFTLKEIPTYDGIQFSNIRVTLYKSRW